MWALTVSSQALRADTTAAEAQISHKGAAVKFCGGIMRAPGGPYGYAIYGLMRPNPDILEKILGQDFYWTEEDRKAVAPAIDKKISGANIRSIDDLDALYRDIFWRLLAPRVKLRESNDLIPAITVDLSAELQKTLADLYKKRIDLSLLGNSDADLCEKNNYVGIVEIMASRRYITLCGLACMLHEQDDVTDIDWEKINFIRAEKSAQNINDIRASDEVFRERLRLRAAGLPSEEPPR